MNVKEIRRRNLRALARLVGGVTHLAERLGKSQSQISHLIGTNPVKNIGDKLAAEVERAFEKPNGWLDHEQEGVREEDGVYQVARSAAYRIPLISWQEVQRRFLQPAPAPATAPTSSEYLLTHVKVSSQAFALRVEG